MGYFSKVQVGDQVQHSAARENAISDLLNQFNGVSAGKNAKARVPAIRIVVYNPLSRELPAGPVAFDKTGKMVANAVPVVPVDDADQPWGILESPLKSGTFGIITVLGMVRAKILGTSDEYAQPDPGSPGVLRYANYGSARVLFHGDGINGETVDPVILLGGGAADAGYNGYFKVINATGEDGAFRVRVVNGADPESLICGHTDLGEVPAVTLTPTESDRVVRLEAKWDSAAGKYVQTLKCVSKTNDGVPSFILADLSFGKKSVSQVWENGTVLWRESYWV